MIVGNKIKYYRKKYKITQSELAERLDKSKQYISKLERDQINISIGLALLITDVFKQITKEKTFGMQMIKLQVEDLFFLK